VAHPRILVELKDVITFPVTQIMKSSFATGVIPDDWKVALVSPIHKNGPKCQVSNYRPISLTSIICKLFESIVRDALVQHLENNGLIRGTQHGFRRGGSCLSNLLQFLDRVTSDIDNGACVDVIYLDFAKAFDKVPHKRLMAKLEKHGIGGKVCAWISQWLNGRSQWVSVRGHSSPAVCLRARYLVPFSS